LRLASSLLALAAAGSFSLASPALADDPGRIDVYVTPYYDSSGPIVRVGRYSDGLASPDEKRFVDTILQMKKRWSELTFMEAYVGAVRLYDWGYRDEATYWFYSAQYRGRQYALLVDQKRLGSIGDRGFELYHAQNAFFQLVGPDVNGYAFGNVDSLVSIVRKVQKENASVPDLQSIYPGVTFVARAQWQSKNATLNAGLGSLASSLPSRKADISRERHENGTEARFSGLRSKPFPSSSAR
jgi:hypothetical protein